MSYLVELLLAEPLVLAGEVLVADPEVVLEVVPRARDDGAAGHHRDARRGVRGGGGGDVPGGGGVGAGPPHLRGGREVSSGLLLLLRPGLILTRAETGES